ncbi:MAG TPA: single-stranded DNA-binding protein [Bryobacteraceae bacterium]|nr:single-stranded DNA-binding protein [Bryobacteraceae bacterium]
MASRTVNKVILLGRLGRDAETRFTPSGAARTTFSMATNYRVKDAQTGEWKDETDWHNVVLWRHENISTFLTKGTLIYVEGRLQTRSYEDKDGKKMYMTEVVGESVILLSGKGEGSQGSGDAQQGATRGPQRVPAQTAPSAPDDAGFSGGSEDDVPF